MLVSGGAFAAADHYVLRDGNHVQHLKITKTNDDITVSADVDFEPNANEAGVNHRRSIRRSQERGSKRIAYEKAFRKRSYFLRAENSDIVAKS